MKPFEQVLMACALAACPAVAWAGEEELAKALKDHQGKVATVVLSSGTELTGKVSGVSEDSVLLVELSGKEYFDALVDLDHVQAVIVRARGR